MPLLGEFLQEVCSSDDLQPFLCKQRSIQKRSVSVAHLATTPLSPTLGMFVISISVSVFLSLCLSVCLCLSACLSVCLSCSLAYSHSLSSGSPQGIYQLHYAPGYTQSQLLCLITQLYDGVPESFEVFYCHLTTTPEELKMFMDRVMHHPLSYLILNVNKLSYNLQEVCVIFRSV